MKRDFTKVMLDIDGKEFGDKATFKSVALMALRAPLQEDPQTPLEQLLKRFDLIEKVHKGAEAVEVTSDEITLIKTRAGKCLSIDAVGLLCRMLEKD